VRVCVRVCGRETAREIERARKKGCAVLFERSFVCLGVYVCVCVCMCVCVRERERASEKGCTV